MSSIEYSFVQTLTATSVGATGPLYFPLGESAVANGTISIIKNLTLVSTQAIGGGSPLFNYVLYSSPTSSGALTPIRCTPTSTISAGTAVNIIGDGNQYVINQPYLVINLNSAAAGTFIIYYSMLQFPASNILNNNFSAPSGITTAGANTIIIPNSPYTQILQTANVMNLTSSTLSFTYTYAGSSITSSTTLLPYTDSQYNSSTYIPSTTGTHNFGVNGSVGLNYYFSVLTNLQP